MLQTNTKLRTSVSSAHQVARFNQSKCREALKSAVVMLLAAVLFAKMNSVERDVPGGMSSRFPEKEGPLLKVG